MIKDNNKHKFKVLEFRIVRLPSGLHILEGKTLHMFNKISKWHRVSDWGKDGSNSGWDNLSTMKREMSNWRDYYEKLAEEKIASKEIISTIEVRRRDTHPEHFV